MLNVNYPIFVNVKEVLVSLFYFYPVSEITSLCFLSYPSFTTNGCHITLLTPTPLIAIYKISCKSTFSREFSQFVEILLSINCQFSSNKVINILCRFGCFLTYLVYC